MTTILGHKFREMTPDDYEGLQGAPDDALICYCETEDGFTTLVAVHAGGGDLEGDDVWNITEIKVDSDLNCREIEWRITQNSIV